ncbi:hypothetical protein AGMMS50239_09750 [Bacteroidia bacterium]|nr:hypothetical protein AGMMS50239_09750 [Bacteroidia bacterium]
MKTQTIMTIITLLFSCGILSAQHSLKKETTRPRGGDEFEKTEMNFFLVENTPKEKDIKKEKTKKEKKNWNFQKLKEKEKKKTYKLKIKIGDKIHESTVEEILPDYTVAYYEEKEGEIQGSENRQLTRTRLVKDSLIDLGYEEPGRRVHYQKPPLVMKYPMELGAEYKSEFTGRGTKDDRLASIHTGTLTTTIDEYGEMILPRGDTLKSVVRVHERKQENIYYEPLSGMFDINAPVNRDSLENSGEPADQIITDTYRWYEEGYRYPIFETVQSCRILKDKTLPLREATYVYVPYEQEFLRQDTENEKIKKEKAAKSIAQKAQEQSKKEDIQPIAYNFYPNPVTDILNLRFNTQEGAETIVSLYELSGREVLRKTCPAENGYRQETLPVSSYPPGTYILRISCGNQYAAEQIVKK